MVSTSAAQSTATTNTIRRWCRPQALVCPPDSRLKYFVHGPTKTVVAKLSTWPVAWGAPFAAMTRLGLTSLAEELAASG